MVTQKGVSFVFFPVENFPASGTRVISQRILGQKGDPLSEKKKILGILKG